MAQSPIQPKKTRKQKEQWGWRIKAMGREGWTKFEKKGEGVGIIRGGLHKAGG